MPWRLILTLTTAAPTPPAPDLVQGFVNAGRLHELCTDDGPEARDSQAICIGYVVGAVDQMLAAVRRPPHPLHSIGRDR